MSWGLPFLLPKQAPVVTLGDALLGGIKSGQEMRRNDVANEAARTNLATLADMNKARLNAVNLSNQFYPKEHQAQIDLMNANAAKARNPLLGLMPTGLLGQEAYVNQLKEKLGEDNPYVQQLIKDMELLRNVQGSQIANRNALASTAQQRILTPQGKSLIEEHNIRTTGNPLGTMPAINPFTGQPTQPRSPDAILSPEEKQQAVNQYELGRIKGASDKETRGRLIRANAIDQTVQQIDPQAVAKYAGFFGKGKAAMNAIATPFGLESKEYDDYVTNKNAIEGLTAQLRQFWGDSISESAKKALNNLTDYSSLANNPDLWMKNYNKILQIYGNDKKAYMQGVTDPRAYQGGVPVDISSSQKNTTSQSDQSSSGGEFEYVNGKWVKK